VKKFTFALAALMITLLVTEDASARIFRRRSSSGSYKTYTSYQPSSADNSSAQGVADTMARYHRVGHWGGHSPYYEGCGSGFSPEQAYRNCCYANSGMKTIDVGYAQGNNGMWYCCRRYSR
jgi:hypothetical protein